MPQIFPKYMNVVARLSILSGPFLFAGAGVSLAAFFRADYTTGARTVVEQPVPFSHKHHVAELGIGCQYCHTSVDKSATAGLPPTRTCINCHQQMWTSAELLKPVRDSFEKNEPIVWNKVHNTPNYVYFNHSIHVKKGVGCYSCHGRIDEMNLVYQSKTLLMEWCLDCHRTPENHLRPLDEVFNIAWSAKDEINEDTGKPYDQKTLGRKLKEIHMVRESSVTTNCSFCHR
ncbi:MAG: cytochrome c family protein [Bacteroidales bacterium]|nr:cytochrome c family protein [Bacteroidales bacterium]